MTSTVFIMTDGLRPDAINSERTPHIWSLMQRGAWTLNAQSVVPSITLPCHTSIFHSVPPSRHGIRDNVWQPLNEPVWGLIEVLKAHNHKAAFIYNWEQLRDLNRPGSLYLSQFIDTGYDLDGDDIIAEMAVRHFASPISQWISFTFVYFASVDVAGHLFKWMSDDYLKQTTAVDLCVGKVLAALPADATVILQSDHGGHDYMHGEDIPEDMTIPWMIAGPNIKQNYQIEHPVSLLDTAPTLAHVLGVPAHELWQGQVVTSAFVE